MPQPVKRLNNQSATIFRGSFQKLMRYSEASHLCPPPCCDLLPFEAEGMVSVRKGHYTKRRLKD
jgi:hypothetical protein